jgi:hypothetical protein
MPVIDAVIQLRKSGSSQDLTKPEKLFLGDGRVWDVFHNPHLLKRPDSPD